MALRIRVSVDVMELDGLPIYGYNHEEVVVLPDDDPVANALTVVERALVETHTAAMGISEQAALKVPQIADELGRLDEYQQAAQSAQAAAQGHRQPRPPRGRRRPR